MNISLQDVYILNEARIIPEYEEGRCSCCGHVCKTIVSLGIHVEGEEAQRVRGPIAKAIWSRLLRLDEIERGVPVTARTQ